MKKFVKKLILLFISIQFAACEGNLEPHLYGVVDTGNAFSTPADLSAATVALYYELRQKGWGLIYSAMEVLLSWTKFQQKNGLPNGHGLLF